ncbi:unnamed protein product [Absidia cylindrospora]
MMFLRDDPIDATLYDKLFLTNNAMYDMILKYLPKLDKVCTRRKFACLMDRQTNLQKLVVKKIDGITQRGRTLYVLKADTMATIMNVDIQFRRHIEAAVGNWVNIGYIRKSTGKESASTKSRLLFMMAQRLVNICFCDKVFASIRSKASQPLLSRDLKNNETFLDGDTQDLFYYVSKCTSKVRLCVMDYAGLSTDPQDVKTMMKLYKRIQEIAVITGKTSSNVDVLLRHSLLSDTNVLNKFDCRSGFIHRSK